MLKLAMIITAAGRSTRFPPNKLLVTLEDRTVIEHTVNTFIDFDMDIIVVLGHQSTKIQDALKNRFGSALAFAYNPDFHCGMASSVITGVKAAGTDYDYWCFCPGDKPFIRQKTIASLLDSLNERKPLIMAARYEGKPGHPTFFSTELLPFFLAARGDVGGRQVMATFPAETRYVDVPDEGTTLDMDDYLEFENAR